MPARQPTTQPAPPDGRRGGRLPHLALEDWLADRPKVATLADGRPVLIEDPVLATVAEFRRVVADPGASRGQVLRQARRALACNATPAELARIAGHWPREADLRGDP